MNITTIGKAAFFLEGDDNAFEYQSSVILLEDVLWFVANWIEETATGKRIPAELVPMEKLPHVAQPDGLFRLGTLIPRELGLFPMPEKLRLAYGAVTNPALAQVRGPRAIH